MASIGDPATARVASRTTCRSPSETTSSRPWIRRFRRLSVFIVRLAPGGPELPDGRGGGPIHPFPGITPGLSADPAMKRRAPPYAREVTRDVVCEHVHHPVGDEQA